MNYLSQTAVTHHCRRLSSCLVFAYEIAVPNSQLEKTLELSTNYKLIFFSIFTSYSLSMLSMNCHALTAACAVFQKRLNYSYLNYTSREVSFPCTPTASSCRLGAAGHAAVCQKDLRKYFFSDTRNPVQSVFRCRSKTPKRRCSSHTFRYGYLVTTSPQSPTLP